MPVVILQGWYCNGCCLDKIQHGRSAVTVAPSRIQQA